jgi:hypothetical protein
MVPAMPVGLVFFRSTDRIPGAADMDRVMAGPLITGALGFGWEREALPNEDRERSMAAMRGSRLISKLSSADPSRRSLPSIRPEQPARRKRIAVRGTKKMAFFRNIII